MTRAMILVGLAAFCFAGVAAGDWTAIRIPMSDGRTLGADLYLPRGNGPWPAILIQTPYNKNYYRSRIQSPFNPDPLLSSEDYAFVAMDWRGFFSSADADYDGAPLRGEDGRDAVEWMAVQPWCDGDVGTWGGSALGQVQYTTAIERPNGLRGCVPITYHGPDRYSLSYPGGIYARNRNDFVYTWFGGTGLVYDHPLDDAYWTARELLTTKFDQIDVPMLHISGWYDHETRETIDDMQALDAQGMEGARGRQRLLIGPWAHGKVGEASQGDVGYPDAEYESSREALRFFDWVLRGIDDGYTQQPKVRYYRINAERWYLSNTWPPSGLQTVTRYLHADGGLYDSTPDSGWLTYVSDPTDPVPTLFGAVLNTSEATVGTGDLRPVEARDDVLTFTTPVLGEPLRIEGEPRAYVWISCSTGDVDVMVRLTDVQPDGRSVLIVDHARRASLRNSFAERQWLTPGEPYEVPVQLPPVSIEIPAGHQLRVLVASSNYDRFDVNPQDGSSHSDEDGVSPVSATVTVLLDAAHPSRIELPITQVTGEIEGSLLGMW